MIALSVDDHLIATADTVAAVTPGVVAVAATATAASAGVALVPGAGAFLAMEATAATEVPLAASAILAAPIEAPRWDHPKTSSTA